MVLELPTLICHECYNHFDLGDVGKKLNLVNGVSEITLSCGNQFCREYAIPYKVELKLVRALRDDLPKVEEEKI